MDKQDNKIEPQPETGKLHFIYEAGGVFADPAYLEEILNEPEVVAILERGIREVQEQYPNDIFLKNGDKW